MNRTVWRLLAASLASLAFPHAGAEASRGTCQCDGILDWNDPSFGKCDWWGDVHITKSWRSPDVFDFQGYGVYSYASTTKCGGDFEMQLFQCPYSRNGNAVAIGVAVKVNNGDVVVVANDTVFNADVSADTMEDLKKGVSIVSDDKCVRLNVNTKLYRRAPTLLHNGNLRVIQEALTNEGICGAPTFGGEFVAPDGPDMLFPEEMFKEMCGFCEDQTGVSVPGCTPAGGGDPVISPGCDFLQLRPSKEFVDCAGDQDPVLEEAKADGENCVAYVRLQKQTSCSEFCTEKGSTCEMAIDQPNGQKCVASVSSLSEIDTSKINCDAKGFRDLICVCKKPDNPAPGPTPEEACAEQTDFSVQDAANLCREKADFLQGVVYPGTGASPDAILKEAFLRACILDVCSAAPEDREEVAENAADQDPSDPPVEPSTTTTTTTAPAVVGDELYVFGFTPYVGSSSPFQPQGVVEVESLPDGTTRLSWSLTGLDPACSSQCNQANCCGVHIHEGKSCKIPAGAHFWDSASISQDPWLSVKYDSSTDPANLLSKEVKTGLSNEDVLGRTVVIHDATGARIACGIIEPSTTTVFEKYPNYGGGLPLTAGGVKVESDDTTQKLSWLFTHGLDPRCDESTCTAANCCGVHIHEGMTCSDADAIGGHYWNKDAHSEDPWKNVRYVIQGSMPSAVNDIMVTTGYGAEDINGRAVVVHDYDGARIGCAIIELPVVETPVEGDDLYVFDFSPYPGSSSPYQPQGVVEVKSTEDDNTVLSWSLTGLDPGCSSPCSQTNCCGIHIHEGTSCAEDAGPHHWNGHDEDPWLSVKYDSSGDPANVLSMEVHTHLTRSDVLGRTLVIHDKTGARIACGIIEDGRSCMV
ncbi:unnamed protein product [Symbiodinium natans]|uniref:Superoxide dismutase [Cu-Zn] n=1 Tax=Symbiodinium natans TaxID=878477 RepID=A0A812SKJ4_9DINO|nr:unnamed protein product [Symbiodinium natans]